MAGKLTSISSDSFLGRLLRLPLRLMPGSARVPILRGRLKGSKWIVGSCANNGCWLGTYEYEQRVAFERLISPGAVVYDVGAHVGFYTLLASRLAEPGGKVIAFEPLPRNLHFLREHLRLNQVSNVRVIELALADRDDEVSFAEGENSFNARISDEGKLRVRTAALDDLISRENLPAPDFIKMDIEGAETMALQGARQILDKYHPVIFLTTHGPQIHEDCIALLCELSYELISLDGGSTGGISRKVIAQPSRNAVNRPQTDHAGGTGPSPSR